MIWLPQVVAPRYDRYSRHFIQSGGYLLYPEFRGREQYHCAKKKVPKQRIHQRPWPELDGFSCPATWFTLSLRRDPQLGRFLGVDPLATSGGQEMFSPYAAMGNAPESMVDPNGEQMQNSRASDPSWSSFAFGGGGRENSDGWGPASGNSGYKGGGGGDMSAAGFDFGAGASLRTLKAAKQERTKTWNEMLGTALANQGTTVYNTGVGPIDHIFLGVDDKGNNQYLLTDAPDAKIAIYNPKHDPIAKQQTSDNWYGPGGQLNWGLSVAGSLFDVGEDLNSMAMYSRGIRRGVYGNYQLTGRNLSLFKNARMTSASRPVSSIARWGG